MRLGILGGSFDPVHAGHVAAAAAARTALGLDRVLLVVAAGQPLKPGGPAAPGEDRYAMVRLAVRGHEGLEASDLELDRPPPSFTVDTLLRVRADLADGDDLVLLLGADALRDLPRWRRVAEVDRLATIVGFTRPGHVLPEAAAFTEALGPERAAALVARTLVLDTPAVSSTDLRACLAAGEDPGGALPAPVARYIAERRLYG